LAERENCDKMNRHKLKQGEALLYDIKTRVNSENFERLQGRLKASHYQTMSEMLRDMICNGQIHVVTVDETLDVVMEQLTGLRKELNAIGVNLNQLTRLLNIARQSGNRSVNLAEFTDTLTQLATKIDPIQEIISQLAKKWLQG
jgi:DNA-binding HxlR family transcriptional regulator